jgi:hypothetical protein
LLASNATLPHVLARLLLSQQPPDEATSSGKLLAEHSNHDIAELIGSCFQRLLLMLVWQLGEPVSQDLSVWIVLLFLLLRFYDSNSDLR